MFSAAFYFPSRLQHTLFRSDFSAEALLPLQMGSVFRRESKKASSYHELTPSLQTNLFEGSWSGSDYSKMGGG